MLLEALQLVYWFAPGYAANAAPPMLARLPLLRKWDAPLDLGRSWRGTRLLGSHKTIRGVVGGILLGGLVFLVQKLLLAGILRTPLVPYGALPWWTGFLLAAGAILVGDAGESLLKRRRGIRPGGHWVPWDQLDYTLGGLLCTSWLFWSGWAGALFLLVFNGLLSAASHFLAGEARLTEEKL